MFQANDNFNLIVVFFQPFNAYHRCITLMKMKAVAVVLVWPPNQRPSISARADDPANAIAGLANLK
jgi:hypothetical protein